MATTAPVTTFDPDTKYRLLLRVDAAEDLAHKSSQGAYCKLFVGDAAALDGSQRKLVKSASSDSNGSSHDDSITNQDEHHDTSFRTQTRSPNDKTATITTWDETFEVALRDPSTDVLSLRVKSQHRFFCPVIGTFALYLRHLRVGHQADQWFPLKRGKKVAGRIRLHLLLTPESTRNKPKKTRKGSDLMPDIKVALAANFEADQAIQRLVAKQLRDEEARRQRRQRGELSDDDNDNDNNNCNNYNNNCNNNNNNSNCNNNNNSNCNNNNNNNVAIAGVHGAEQPVKLGSNRAEARFAVLLPPSPTAAATANGSGAMANKDNRRADATAAVAHTDNFARLKQLEPIAAAQKETHRIGDALGSGRNANGSRRQSLPTPSAAAIASPVDSSIPLAQPPATTALHSQFFGAVDSPVATTASAPTNTLTDAERSRRRAANFAQLQALDDAEELAVGAPVATPVVAAAANGSDRGSSSRRSSRSRPSSARGSTDSRVMLYSIPSFGHDELLLPDNHNNKRDSTASSTDSDTRAAAFERRIDRKLRNVRKATEKLRKLKRQLRKYMPDLTDSESDLDSDLDDANGSATTSPEVSPRRRNSSSNERMDKVESSNMQQQLQRYYF